MLVVPWLWLWAEMYHRWHGKGQGMLGSRLIARARTFLRPGSSFNQTTSISMMNQAEHDLLVMDAQNGSRMALDSLVRHHHRNLLRFAYSLCRETALAQDAVQDAWIRVAGRLRSLDDPRAFRGWVYHAVRWRVFDLLKRSDRGGRAMESAEAEVETPAGDEDRDRRIDLGAAIAELPDADRETLQLFYVSGLTVPEIVVVLNIPAGTVKSRLHRARNQLRQHFEGEHDEHR